MGRKLAREYTMKLLYQVDVQKEELNEQFVNQFIEETIHENCDVDYIREVALGVANNLDKIDELIKAYSKGWNINRLAKVDLAILRLSAYEILNRKDIPPGVSINEAVELSKAYSSDDAPAFVNGVLGTLYRGEVEHPNG